MARRGGRHVDRAHGLAALPDQERDLAILVHLDVLVDARPGDRPVVGLAQAAQRGGAGDAVAREPHQPWNAMTAWLVRALYTPVSPDGPR